MTREEIKEIIEWQMDVLLNMIENKEGPFNQEVIEKYYQIYLESSH